MRIKLGILKSKIETDNPIILQKLYEKYGVTVPGSNFSPSVIRRQWDGKKRFISKTGEFRSGLLPRILKDLEKIRCFPSFEGKINLVDTKLVKIDKFKYRDYQKKAIEFCLKNGRCLVESPTGSGKTLIMAGIVRSLQEEFPDMQGIILFKEKGILKQTYEFFKTCGVKNIGINFGEGFEYGNIMLSTIQSIEKILDTHLEKSILLMADEVHQFGVGDVSVAAIQAFSNAYYRFGFSATIPGETPQGMIGRLNLEGAFGEIYTTISMSDLADQGNITKPIIQIIRNCDGVEDDVDGLTYPEIYDKFIIKSQERNNKILKIINSVYLNNKSPKVLILVKNLEHTRILNNLIPNSFIVEGVNSLEERYALIDKFIESENAITLIGTNVLQTGISIDDISHMINARGLKGEIPTIQGLGRGVRKSNKFDKFYYYDFLDAVEYLRQHSKSRIKHYKNLNFEINYVEL